MMKKLPFSLNSVCFHTYTADDMEAIENLAWELPFDERHDFLIDDEMVGMAVRIVFYNERFCSVPSRGARRTIIFTIIDTTERCEIASRSERVYVSKYECLSYRYLYFPLSELELKGRHTYKLLVRDESTSMIMGEFIFHMFSELEFGDPADWYGFSDAGVRPDVEKTLYKSIRVENGPNDYNVRFNLKQNFGNLVPEILPELELRLYHPDKRDADVQFVEPVCVEFYSNTYFAELPFFMYGGSDGIFYAEARCMDRRLAGFVFRIGSEDVRGSWSCHEIEPLKGYSPEDAQARFYEFMPTADRQAVQAEEDSDSMFKEGLDEFIAGFNLSDYKESLDEVDGEEDAGSGEAAGGTPERSVAVAVEMPLPLLLDDLTGLQGVKEKLRIYERVVRFNKLRSDMGLPTSQAPLHAMFLGSPGTGKTTVAKLMGYMLQCAGVLSKGHVVVRERASLLGQNYHSESEKTLAALEEAQGGILFIDEAYQLYQPGDSRDPGKFVIETLLTALADDSRRDWMLVLAGYPDEMKRMFDMNPGFKSRIPESNIYQFDDFSEPELMDIAERYLERHRYVLAPDARTALADRLKSDYSQRDKSFGNARHVLNLIQTEILTAMAVRVTERGGMADRTTLTEIQAADIPGPVVRRGCARQRVGF